MDIDSQVKLETVRKNAELLLTDGSLPMPEKVCEDLLSHFSPDSEQNVLVLFDLVLAVRMSIIGYENITILTDTVSPHAEAVIKYFGLTHSSEDEIGDMKFDLVIGNPPYQKPTSGKDRVGSRGNTSIWDRFVVWGLEHTVDGGYMAMVHPTSWRKPNDRWGFWDLLTKDNQMVSLTMRSGRREQNLFKIGVRFDYYVVEKTPKYKATKVIDHEDKSYTMDLAKWNWLPNYAIREIKSLLGGGCEVVYNTKYHTQKGCSERQGKRNSMPVIHTIGKDGIGVKYFKDEHKDGVHFGTKKVVLNQNEVQYPFDDSRGEYGMSQLSFGIKVRSQKQAKQIIKFLNSDLGKRIIAATKWNTFYTDYNMFSDFREDFYDC